MMTRRGFLLGTAAAGTLVATGIPLLSPEPIPERTVSWVQDSGHVEGDLEGTIVDCRFDMPNRMELTIRLDDGRVIREIHQMGVLS